MTKAKATTELPIHLATDEFEGLWEEFREFRKAKKEPMTPRAEARLLKKLSYDTHEVACLKVEQSLDLGWIGIFPVHQWWLDRRSGGNGTYRNIGRSSREVFTNETVRRVADGDAGNVH